MQKTFFVVLCAFFLSQLAVPSAHADGPMFNVCQGTPYVIADEKEQRFTESIDLNKGQEKLEQMTLTLYNGTQTAPGFTWIRISSPNMRYISEQDFHGKKEISIDVTGELTWGGNQMIITGAGPKGATFDWLLSAGKPQISGVTPTNVMTGQIITINGSNLSTDPDIYKVTVGNRTVPVGYASATALKVRVPEDLPSGINTIDVSCLNMEAGQGAITVTAVPVLKAMSTNWAPPGQQVDITGENFSENLSDNQVYVGGFPAQVVAASKTRLSILIPVNFGNMFPQPYMPVTVVVNGVSARNRLSISVNLVG